MCIRDSCLCVCARARARERRETSPGNKNRVRSVTTAVHRTLTSHEVQTEALVSVVALGDIFGKCTGCLLYTSPVNATVITLILLLFQPLLTVNSNSIDG